MRREKRGNGGHWVMPVRHFSDKRQRIDALSCCHLVKVKSESRDLLLVLLPRYLHVFVLCSRDMKLLIQISEVGELEHRTCTFRRFS
jgi:hypothetical protein